MARIGPGLHKLRAGAVTIAFAVIISWLGDLRGGMCRVMWKSRGDGSDGRAVQSHRTERVVSFKVVRFG